MLLETSDVRDSLLLDVILGAWSYGGTVNSLDSESSDRRPSVTRLSCSRQYKTMIGHLELGHHLRANHLQWKASCLGWECSGGCCM
jgi:hypothetical protein